MKQGLLKLLSTVALTSVVVMPQMTEAPLAHADELFPYTKTFTISAYYSPCEGQERYVTGTHAGDIRLNGNGTNGADGTPVYPGMIAAPKTYPFGTKMSIPGIGITAVHDRGGAIVTAGNRNQNFDRLDVWMGYCDIGLNRALTWGKKAVQVNVYGIDDSIEESVYLEGFSMTEAFVKNVVLAPQLFEKDIWYLQTGEDVEELQSYLQILGYFQGEITGFYGDDTREAVYQFQLESEIIETEEDLGAGHTGVNTRKLLDLAVARLKEEQEQFKFQRQQQGLLLLSKYPDLNKSAQTFARTLTAGMVGDDVRLLQDELVNMGFLRIEATGYFGELTEHAVYKFQQKRGIVSAKEDDGAGVVGPQTRSSLNSIVGDRLQNMSYLAYTRNERQPLPEQEVVLAAEEQVFPRHLTLDDRGNDVKELQSLLKQLGFFKGAFLTQFYGEQTKVAVQVFQAANGLEETGSLDDSTRALLNSLI
jgi:peptidoglycan hydrolase-like protein with peptidoglycan-binding domain/3D (Asp-Asp-Asp) domain-containing protein